MNIFSNISFGVISAILTFVSAYSYMKAIYTREIKRPVISTLALWLVIGILLFFTSIELGASIDTTLPQVAMGVINPCIVFMLSLRYGDYSWNKIDSVCVILSAGAIVVWQTTESPFLGLVGGIAADIVAATPMVIKSFRDPKDEPVFPWVLFTIASMLNIFAVKEWSIEQWLFPVYMTCMGLIISLPLILYRVKISKRV